MKLNLNETELRHSPDAVLRQAIEKIEAELDHRQGLRARPLPTEDGIYKSGDGLWDHMLILDDGEWYGSWRRDPLGASELDTLVYQAGMLIRMVPESVPVSTTGREQ